MAAWLEALPALEATPLDDVGFDELFFLSAFYFKFRDFFVFWDVLVAFLAIGLVFFLLVLASALLDAVSFIIFQIFCLVYCRTGAVFGYFLGILNFSRSFQISFDELLVRIFQLIESYKLSQNFLRL